MEDGQSTAEAEAKIAALEAETQRLNKELDTLHAQRDAERKELKEMLDAANTEIAQLQQGKNDQQKASELPKEAVKVLVRIEKYIVRCNAAQMAHDLKIPNVRAQHWLDELASRRMIREAGDGYFIDKKGRAYLVENGLDIEERKRPALAYANLPALEQTILMMLKGEKFGKNERTIAEELVAKNFKVSPENTKLILEKLDQRKMVTSVSSMSLWGTPDWFLTQTGADYLAERGLFP